MVINRGTIVNIDNPQYIKDVITVAVGFKNMPQFYIKFGRKSIKKLITNGVLMRRTSK